MRGSDIYNNRHFLFLFLTGGGQRTARIASSNTVLRPRCVSAEHSRYLTAPRKDSHRALMDTPSGNDTPQDCKSDQFPRTKPAQRGSAANSQTNTKGLA